jgi:hypothetical protein
MYFWGIYEVGFPEGSHVKAPGDSDFPFGAFFVFVNVLSLDISQNFY